MSDLNNIVSVTISRETQSVARASFGVFAIISEFSTTKTTAVFDRFRTYASLTEMTNDGWLTTDPEYKAAQLVFTQNPKVENILIGRKDTADADWSNALTAIQVATPDWYGLMIIGYEDAKLVWGADFVTSNSIAITVNGTAVTPVVFNTNQATTMADLKTQIEADVTGAAVTITTDDPDTRTLLVKVAGKAANSISAIVTLGASQASSISTVSTTKIVFSVDFITGNSIVVTINGTAVTAVPFNTNHDTTMADLKTQIETDITTSIVTLDASDGDTRTLLIDLDDDAAAVSAVVTGGASQPTNLVSTNLTDVYKETAAWTETEKKIFFYSSSLIDIKGTGSLDIASFMKAQNYDRTTSIYHIASQGDSIPAWMESAWAGETFPFDPGSQTWGFKTLAGVASYGLTSAERTNILGKNAAIYTSTAGVDNTEQGKVASGEWIDIIRGLDQVESRLQEAVFTELVTSRKVPFTDGGISVMAGIVEGVLKEAARDGILVDESIVVTKPLAADVPSADKINRLLPDINFTATLQGAIQEVEINGVVTV